MAQQQQDGKRSLLPILILWIGFIIWWQFFAPKPQPGPQQTTPALVEAGVKEVEGGRPMPVFADKEVAKQVAEKVKALPKTERSKADQIKSLKEAAEKYEAYYNADKKDPKRMELRFREVNLYDYLARLEGSGTQWYDQAEHILKDAETAFLGKQGTVTLEVDGRKEMRTGDMGKIATARLDAIREARDVRNRNKPTYWVISHLVGLFGGAANPSWSYFLALLLLVVVLKGVTYPFQKKQYAYQRDMMRVQPLVKEMQEKMKGRPPEEINKRMFQIYKENNVNMAAGCLPMLVQMIVLFPVFWMVKDFEYQFTHAKFLWIGLQATEKLWWIAHNLAQFDVPLFVLYILSTVAFSLLQPKPADPQQAQQQKIMMYTMPLVFGVMMWMWKWSSAFMLYWLLLNLVSMAQSWRLNKHYGVPATASHSTATEGGSSGGGGGMALAPAPDGPLKPMKGVHTPSTGNGKNGNKGAAGMPGRVRPRSTGKKK